MNGEVGIFGGRDLAVTVALVVQRKYISEKVLREANICAPR